MLNVHAWLRPFALVALFAGSASQAATYDATADFSIASNPNGVWSYGYAATGVDGYALIPFDTPSTESGFINWRRADYVSLGAPAAYRNTDGVAAGGVGPYQLALHPGPAGGGDFAILRFTAPTTATYTLTGQFFAGNSGDASGSIVRNTVFSAPLQFFSNTTDSSLFALAPLALTAGDTVDFLVGNNGSFFSDGTPLAASFTTAVPEPATFAMLVAGLLVVGSVARRKRAP